MKANLFNESALDDEQFTSISQVGSRTGDVEDWMPIGCEKLI
jgi:hypothetical protein